MTDKSLEAGCSADNVDDDDDDDGLMDKAE